MADRLRWFLEILGGFSALKTLPPQYSLYIYTVFALVFSWEIFLVLSKRQSISSFLINFREKVGKVMSYLIIATIGAFLAIGYWWGIQRIFSPRQISQQEVRIPNLNADFDIFGAAPDPNNAENSIVAIKATITNTGVPSIVNNIAVSVRVDNRQVNGQPIPIPSEFTMGTNEGNTITYKGEDFLRIKGMNQPIPTNGGIPGLDVFFFPNVSKQEVLKTGTIFTLTFQDVLGKKYIFKKTMTGERVPLLNIGISKKPEKKDASVLDLIKQYPTIDEVVKGLKSCQDLSPDAQQVCVKEISRITFAQMVLKEPGLTAEQRTRILQQTTLEDMKRVFNQTSTLGAVASINSKAYSISAIPPEVATVYLFLQKEGTLEKGSSEFLGSVSREEFPKKISQYETLAKSKHMKLILRTVAKDQTQWLQNQIKYNQEFLKKTTFFDPSNDKISEGEEWPVD